jgi:hypothetical protein
VFVQQYECKFLAGPDSQFFWIEEAIGRAGWPGKFRVKIPATTRWEARAFYGDSYADVAQQVTTFLTAFFAPQVGLQRKRPKLNVRSVPERKRRPLVTA